MKIGFVGLGKLGLPVAITIAYKGHSVLGYDINPKRLTYELDTNEAGLDGNPNKSNYSELFDLNPNTKGNLSLERISLLIFDNWSSALFILLFMEKGFNVLIPISL